MSVVSGVVLCTSCCEAAGDDDAGLCWEAVNAWLDAHKFAPLARVDGYASGTKSPQQYVGHAGYNYFPEDDFAAFILSLDWEHPSNVVLVIEPEDGATRVWRPKEFS